MPAAMLAPHGFEVNQLLQSENESELWSSFVQQVGRVTLGLLRVAARFSLT